IASQNDGRVLIGGGFTSVNGIGRNHVARLNSDGTLDNRFDPGTGSDGGVLCLVLQLDGKVLVGGRFLHVNGVVRNGIARLNGVDGGLDLTFDPGAGTDGPVNSIALQPDGKLLIGGEFTRVNGNSRTGIARLNPDGTLDGSFDPGSGAH